MCEGNISSDVALQCVAWYLPPGCAMVMCCDVVAGMGMMDADR